MRRHSNSPKRLLLAAVAAFLLIPHLATADDIRITRDVVYGDIKPAAPAAALPSSAAGPQAAADGAAGGQATDIKLKLDVYEPDPAHSQKPTLLGRRPGVLVIHGGGWFSGDKSDAFDVDQCKMLAENGFIAFCVNYRLVPQYRYPAQLDDVQRAVRWVRAHADTYQVDPLRLAAMGDSAGGHLASLLGTRDTRDNSDPELAAYSSRVECVVDMFGPVDFLASTDTLKFPAISTQLVLNFLGKKREEAPELYKEVSPISHVDRKSAPFLILHGDLDPLVPVDQSRRLLAALQKAGIAATLIVMPKDYHGFRVEANRIQQKSATVEFLTRYLKP